jgi:cyclic-di-GMP-binding protein
MFGFFKRNKDNAKNQDPLSDLRTVSRWMENLPTGDIYSAQEQVVQSLIQFNHAGLAMSKERLQVLMHLDEQARDMQYSLCQQYLRNPRMSKVIESRLWTAIHAFYWEITRGYHAFLMDFVSNPGGSKIQQHIPLIAARAIRGFGDIFKWRYFRYERAEEKLWLRMHNIYRIAEFDGFQNNRFKLYEQEAKVSSCMEEYVRALLLTPLGAGSLTARQIEMVDKWLTNWSNLTALDSEYKSGNHNFLVDTSHGQGLRRIRPNTTTENSYRFISTEALLAHLDKTTQSLKSGSIPASLGLGEDFRLPDGYDLIDYVTNEWASASERERRQSPRETMEGRCEVLHDLANICQRMQLDYEIATGQHGAQALTPEEILDIKLYGFVTERTKTTITQRSMIHSDQAIERWSMRDRSDSGLGISLKNEQSEWVRVGKLLALRLDPTSPWQIAVVRRISRQDEEWRKVGIRILPYSPSLGKLESAVDRSTLTYAADGSAYGGEEVPSPVLLFPHGENGPSLILEASRYAHGRQYQLLEGGKSRLIQLDSVTDKGDGWLMSTFFSIN